MERESGGSVRVRAVVEGDFDTIAQITNHYIRHTSIHFSTEDVSASSLREAWLKTRERYPFLVAEGGGEVVGYAKAGVWRERAAYAWTPESGVYVREGLHGRGVGRRLYKALFNVMARQGFRSVVAGVTLPNEASVGLHRAVGFEPQGVIASAGWKMGRWWDVAFFQKMLREGEARELRAVSEVMAEGW